MQNFFSIIIARLHRTYNIFLRNYVDNFFSQNFEQFLEKIFNFEKVHKMNNFFDLKFR